MEDQRDGSVGVVATVPVRIMIEFAEADGETRAYLTRVAVKAVAAELARLSGVGFRVGPTKWYCDEGGDGCEVQTDNLAGWIQTPDGRDICPPCGKGQEREG
jgi:hypothetical protein